MLRTPAGSEYFYPRPPRGGRRKRCPIRPHDSHISIHALREEGDRIRRAPLCRLFLFLSTPSARRATSISTTSRCHIEFLSTPSARRATLHIAGDPVGMVISIHALREEGDFAQVCKHRVVVAISIHALREEGDESEMHGIKHTKKFLSTPSARRATLQTYRPKKE